MKKLLTSVNRWLRPLIVKGTNNKVSIRTKQRKNFVIRVYGNNNIIEIGENCRLHDSNILLLGDNNKLILDDVAKFDGPVDVQLAGNAVLKVGSNSGIRGVNIYVRDGKVDIGRNCIFSYGINIRNNDSHQVHNYDGEITNYPGDIIIGDHVWLCQDSSIIKGVTIGSDSIVAFGAIVVKGCPPHSILAGNPAKVVKEGIDWCNKPIPLR